jgi:hypothetical protein
MGLGLALVILGSVLATRRATAAGVAPAADGGVAGARVTPEPAEAG